MSVASLKQKLENELSDWFDWEICNIDNQDSPLLIIFNFSTGNNKELASFALDLSQYENGTLPSKCWISEIYLKEGNGEKPNQCPIYRKFSYGGKTFHPFSANLSGYNPSAKGTIKLIVDSLYHHIDWRRNE